MTIEMNHIVTCEGLCVASLGLMQKCYGRAFLPAVNRRMDINGTLQRPPYWPEDFDSFVDGSQKSKGKDEVFATLMHEDGPNGRAYRYLGHTGIHRITWPDGIGSTGSMIVEATAQGKGIGTEAKLLLLYHAFEVLGLANVRSTVKAWNAKSLGHLIKCGYRIVGRYEKILFHEGKLVDEILLQVSPALWRPVWNQYQETKQLPKLTDEQRELVKIETNT